MVDTWKILPIEYSIIQMYKKKPVIIIDSKSKSAVSHRDEYFFLDKTDCYSRTYCIHFYLFSYLIQMSGPTIATIVLIVLIAITVFGLFLDYFLRRRFQRQLQWVLD